jgi:pimeloyl-ACP methyl ester carboxylesterase
MGAPIEAPRALLLHGLWLRGLVLLPLQRRLRVAGIDAHCFDYASVWAHPRAHIERIAERVRALPGDGPVHLVGHSMGGLLAIETARAHPELPIGRILCLGSPITGSSTASHLHGRRGLRRVLGRGTHLLQAGVLPLPEGFEVGMIAGTMRLGLGRWFGLAGERHDGTVSVDETRAAELRDHIEIHASHTGLIYSAAAARQVVAFLGEGRFER